MARNTLRNVNRSDKYEIPIVQKLTNDPQGNNVFPTIRELLCFAAMLGYALGKKNKFPENKEAFIGRDILKLDPSDINSSNSFRVVGNIPYNISSPILEWCEKHYEKIYDIHFMLQKEFALRCAGSEKTSSYGRLSVICNYLYEVTILKEVSKDFFNPMPKVDSLFVRFSPKKKEVDRKELDNLKQVTRALFNKKRKKISNSLEDILNTENIEKLNLNLNLRPDELSLEEYLQISSLIKNNG